MSFTNNKAIFEQIADRLADEIVAGKNSPPRRQTRPKGDAPPPPGEYASMLQVNNNTAIKGYELLAQKGIVYNKRGMGYFVADNARQHIIQLRQDEVMNTMLPELFRQMRLLHISIDEVERRWAESQEA